MQVQTIWIAWIRTVGEEISEGQSPCLGFTATYPNNKYKNRKTTTMTGDWVLTYISALIYIVLNFQKTLGKASLPAGHGLTAQSRGVQRPRKQWRDPGLCGGRGLGCVCVLLKLKWSPSLSQPHQDSSGCRTMLCFQDGLQKKYSVSLNFKEAHDSWVTSGTLQEAPFHVNAVFLWLERHLWKISWW